MAKARFYHDGKSIDYTPSGDLAAGDVVVQGELVGITPIPIRAGHLGALAVSGVFAVTKAAGDGGIAVGVPVYWDVADQVAQDDADSGTNKLMGKSIAAAATADTVVYVLLGQ